MNKYLLSSYTINSAKGIQLGNQYIELSIEALVEDDEKIKLRSLKNNQKCDGKCDRCAGCDYDYS